MNDLPLAEVDKSFISKLLIAQEGGHESEHFVQFYENDAFLIDSLSTFIGAGLRAKDVCIVIATQPHKNNLVAKLQANELDISSCIFLDAKTILSQIMIDGLPDAQRFEKVVGKLVADASTKGRRVRAFGEMVALLWAEGNEAGALRLEQLWNDLAIKCSFILFCAYPLNSFAKETQLNEFAEICLHHSRVVPAESYSSLESSDKQLREITLLQQKAASLQAEVIKRKQLEKQKDEFLTIAAHELKTPLTSLKAFSQLLKRHASKTGDTKAMAYLQRMNDHVDRLDMLVSDLVDVSAIEEGKLKLAQTTFDYDALVQDIITDVQTTTGTHTIKKARSNGPISITGDRFRLGQVLNNIITNAIAYSPMQDIITVRVKKKDKEIITSVQDFGIGIAQEHIPQLFTKFYRVEDNEMENYPGLGLGLYIASEIVKRHQGNMWVESIKGEGSTFYFSLPLS